MEERRVRICDLAEELGLSTATVSNVIHGKTQKVSDATVQRVTALLEGRTVGEEVILPVTLVVRAARGYGNKHSAQIKHLIFVESYALNLCVPHIRSLQ